MEPLRVLRVNLSCPEDAGEEPWQAGKKFAISSTEVTKAPDCEGKTRPHLIFALTTDNVRAVDGGNTGDRPWELVGWRQGQQYFLPVLS